MAVNKVVYGSNTLVDLTSDTVTSEKLIEGTTAHNKKGEQITGSYKLPYVSSSTLVLGGNASVTSTTVEV